MIRNFLLLLSFSFILTACTGGSAFLPSSTISETRQTIPVSPTLLPSATVAPSPTKTPPPPTGTLPPTNTPVVYSTWDLASLRKSRESCLSIGAQIGEFNALADNVIPPDLLKVLHPCYGGNPLEAAATEMAAQLGRTYMNANEVLFIFITGQISSSMVNKRKLEFYSDGFNRHYLAINFDPQTGVRIKMDPHDITLLEGDAMLFWGMRGYTTVWAGTATYPSKCIESPDTPMDYYCRLDPPRSNQYWGSWGNDTLHIAGIVTQEGETIIQFDKPYRDIVVVWAARAYVDSIVGILPDGTLVPMGYTPHKYGKYEFNGKLYSPVLPFLESDGAFNHTINQFGWDSHAFSFGDYNPQPCGFLGLGPDNNLIKMGFQVEKAEGMLTLFPLYPASNLEYGVYQRGLYAHEIVGIILTQYSKVPADAIICESTN